MKFYKTIQVLVYDKNQELSKVIFSPSIKEAVDFFNIKNDLVRERVRDAITYNREAVLTMAPIFLSKEMMYINVFEIGKELWCQHIREQDELLIMKKELALKKKIEKEERKKQSDIRKKKRDIIKGNRKKIKSYKKNHYIAIFAYADTGEIYAQCEADTVKMIAYRAGINKQKVSSFYNKTVILKTNKKKHIQKEIEKRGLCLTINVKPI